MTTRRGFMQQTAAAVVTGVAPCSAPVVATQATRANFPGLRSIILRDETMLRLAGVGSPYGVTWMTDDRQLVAVVEGGVGWPGLEHDFSFASALLSMRGAPQNALFESVPQYPRLALSAFYRENGLPPYWGGPTLAIGEHLYQYMSTFSGSVKVIDGVWTADGAPSAVKLIHSPDNGRTWRNQDGSTPVKYESGKEQSRENMIFWNEPQGVFAYPVLLQMGRAYQDNRDGYVYGYSTDQRETRRELFMFRVPKERLLDRGQYEYFAGLHADGDARWHPEIDARQPVLDFTANWGCSSVAYNRPLGLYLMACSHLKWLDQNATVCDSSASGLGFWVASKPWGPWVQMFETSPWRPGHQAACAARPLIAPKWIAEDGKSFWLVWTDMYQGVGFDISSLKKAFYAASDAERTERLMNSYRDFLPYYRFNVQRVDLGWA